MVPCVAQRVACNTAGNPVHIDVVPGVPFVTARNAALMSPDERHSAEELVDVEFHGLRGLQIREGSTSSTSGANSNCDGHAGGPAAVIPLLDYGVVSPRAECQVRVQLGSVYAICQYVRCSVDAHGGYALRTIGRLRSSHIVHWRCNLSPVTWTGHGNARECRCGQGREETDVQLVHEKLLQL